MVRKTTKTYKFILPLLVNDRHNGFINSFIDKDNIVVVLNKPINEFTNLDTIINSKIISVEEKGGNTNITLEIPNKFKEDFLLFLEGKYSKFSTEAKVKICEYHKGNKNPEDTEYYKILYKTPDRKQFLEDRLGVTLDNSAELFSILELEEEVYGK